MASKYPEKVSNTVPARSGVAVPLRQNQTIQVINTHGTQVIDFWAFSTKTLSHYLSMCHTRGSTLHLSPLVNDILVTNQRKPILQLIIDDTPGVHDTLIAACDIYRYQKLTNNEGNPDYYHDNCSDNLRKALSRDMNQVFPEGMGTPDPLNLFMNIPVIPKPSNKANDTNNNTAGASLSFEAPLTQPGQSVTFKILMDCIVVMSACPQDLVKVNNMEPTEAHFIIDG